jgi:hypothetical protein
VNKNADLSLFAFDTSGISVGACPPCVNPEPLPTAFCADDKHCAVRRTETVKGALSTTCLSPTQAGLDIMSAAQPGCDCSNVGSAGCLRASATQELELRCGSAGSWEHTKADSGLCGP